MRVSWESSAALPTQTLRLLKLSQRAFAGPLHAHDAIELTWIRSGHGVRLAGDAVEPFGPGDLVLVAPGAPHTWLTSGRQRGLARALVLQLRPGAELTALPEWQQVVGPWLARPAAAWVLTGSLADEVRAALLQLEHARGLHALGLALAMLDRIARHALEGSSPPARRRAAATAADVRPAGTRDTSRTAGGAQPAQRRVDALLAWTRRHLATEIHAEDAAALLHVTPAAFSRAFKRLVGKPYTVYVNDLRIAEACLRLGRSDRPVAEIALQCGYTTLSHFNAQFRLRMGQTPATYRSTARA